MRNPTWIRDEIILALDLYFRTGRRQLPPSDPQVARLSALLGRLSLHAPEGRAATFRNANGISMILGNFLGVDPAHAGRGLARNNRLQLDVWRDYAHDPERLRTVAEAIGRQLESEPVADRAGAPDDGEAVFPEGLLLTRLHIVRERSPLAVERKKRAVLAEQGSLACEACGFDFELAYGPLGRGFAECHHTRPLSELPHRRGTRLAELAIVCANCHRMLHRARPVMSVQELRSRVQDLRHECTGVLEPASATPD